MNLSLTPALERFVRGKVASGLYNNASEVVREALRLLVAADGAHPAVAPTKEGVRTALAELAPDLRRRGIRTAHLYGSVLHGTATPESDVDLLIDPDGRKPFDLVDLVGVKQLIEDRLGHPVDIALRDGLHPSIRRKVVAEAERVL